MKSILFVDDEPDVLESIENNMRRCRDRWATFYAESGETAISLLEQRPFDLVVSDMRMPAMDGAELLSQVQRRWPSCFRVILSGHAEPEALLRAIPVTHQILSKPCSNGDLVDTIGSLFDLDSQISNDQIHRYVVRFGWLPIPEIAYSKVLLLAQNEASPAQITEALQEMPLLAARVLQVANSPYFGLHRKIDSLAQGVSGIGRDLIATLLLKHQASIAERAMYADFVAQLDERANRILHLVKYLIGPTNRDDSAHTTSLLANIGQYVFLAADPVRYERILSESGDDHVAEYEREVETYGISHAELGGYLLHSWGFPQAIVQNILHHHDRNYILESPILSAIQIAENTTFNFGSATLNRTGIADYGEDKFGMLKRLPGIGVIAGVEARLED